MDAEGASPTRNALDDAGRRFRRLFFGLVIAYALAIVFDNGEFWPFSKFPMFSRSGRPWYRAYVSEVSPAEAQAPLDEIWEKELPGHPFPLHHHQINQDDLSAVVRSLKPPIGSEQTDFLAKYFDRVRHERTMILYSVSGRFRPDKSVRERYTPLVIIGPEGVRAVSLADASVDSGGPSAEAGIAVDAGDAGVRQP